MKTALGLHQAFDFLVVCLSNHHISIFLQILKKSGVVCSCYGIIENIIGYMTTGSCMGLQEKQISQLHSAMMGAFNSVIFFLSQIEQHEINLVSSV